MITCTSRECCAFCGLPLARPWWSRRREQPAAAAPRYCCYGCALAHTVTTSGTPTGEVRALLTRLGVGIFLTMNVMVFSMELWTQDVYSGGAGMTSTLAEPLRDVFRYLCLLLSLPVLWLLGRPIAANAWQNLRQGGPNTDLLIVLGVAAAMIYSAISVFRGSGHIYFEVGCVVLIMVTLGRWLDATGKLQTTAALDALEKLLPEQVRLVRDGRTSFVPPAEVRTGDCLRLLAGERFAFDGRLLAGQADVDEQILTGESRPVTKGPGDAVHAGALNFDGDLLVSVTAELRDGTLQRMIDLVREARLAKGYHQRLADRASAWFLPAVAILAITTFAIHAASGGFEQGLLAGLAVSLIACPCALGLATPMAVWAALGRASQDQVLVRSGEALERLAAVRVLALDKTGTLTTGIARVAEFVTDAAEESDSSSTAILSIAAAMAEGSNHPLSAAIDQFARDHGARAQPATTGQARARTLPGLGIVANLPGGQTAWLGNLRLMQERCLAVSDRLSEVMNVAERQARSLTCIGWDGSVRGVFVFTEDVRPDAQGALEHCRQIGLHVCVLTGDHPARAAALAESLGVYVEAELLPGDKVAAVGRLRREWGAVAMVGDGINDAPALVAADVGIAMGCGADVSRDSASICLLGDQLGRVPETVELAQKTVRIIRQNLFWAFFYNVGGIALACVGWLNPVWAAVAMVASSVLVIGNSLRLRGPAPMFSPDQAAEGDVSEIESDSVELPDEALTGEGAAWRDTDSPAQQEQIA